ncbi:nucleotidyltransferase domain-containing protein [Candidatus Woesearchaeota archaeon]|nr:nucleotidyltransferase domain-containing protein [Candidatus Woesearchaeota archaeon]
MKSRLISYSMDFASFLIQKIKERSNIKNIILFGSVAREEASKSSDVDLFIDVAAESPSLEKGINGCLISFLDSAKYKNYWKMLGVENEIKLRIGRLDKWKELNPSIIANGITIYGKFKPKIKEGKHMTFFIWENIKPNSKRVLFNKQIFGYKQGKKFYNGLIQKYEGERLGKGCIIIPLENSLTFHKLFRKYGISVKIKKILDYTK